ncbi:MAG: nicotinate-nucleotide adenylyltransferase [Candidatus Palauibacterales bacterium]|nr:nicotinate-nucleotide adenylyltransferase [Candidatus Palauibacterales bacterium]MDP2482757.1 nicotinate-nucleotide adenylyltransferase [Candidatus Palauibacterales bacterium]
MTEADVPLRLGIFGGTFDPPHIGHLVVAQDALESLTLDRLLVIPAGRPPHRAAAFAEAERLEFARLAFAGDERIEVSDVEVRREGPSWTVDTLEWARTELKPSELFLIVGADQLGTLGGWREPERILRLARLAVMTRNGETLAETEYPYEMIEVTRVDLSSTQVRKRLREGRSIRYMVPEHVRPAVERAWSARSTE